MKYKCLEKIRNNEVKEPKILKFMNKVLLAIFLGLVSLIVMEYSPKFKTFMQEEVLGNNISFAFLNNLYNKYFGTVLPQNNDNLVQVFNEKMTYIDKIDYENGVKLTVSNDYLVPSLTSGVVVFIGERDNLGKVITIEGEDNSTITYGNIHSTDLKLYDYIAKGKYLGDVSGNTLYITIVKNGEYQDFETYLSG